MSDNSNSSSLYADFLQGFPLIYNHLSKKDVLECRKIDPCAKNIVDNILVNIGRNTTGSLDIFPSLKQSSPTVGTLYRNFECFHLPMWTDFTKAVGVTLTSTRMLEKLQDQLMIAKSSGMSSPIPSKRIMLIIPPPDVLGFWRLNVHEKPNRVNKALQCVSSPGQLPITILDTVIETCKSFSEYISFVDISIFVTDQENATQMKVLQNFNKILSLPFLESVCFVYNIGCRLHVVSKDDEFQTFDVLPDAVKLKNLHVQIDYGMPLGFYLSMLETYGNKLDYVTIGEISEEPSMPDVLHRLKSLKKSTLNSLRLLRCGFQWIYLPLINFVNAPHLAELNLLDMVEHSLPLLTIRVLLMHFPNLKTFYLGKASLNRVYSDKNMSNSYQQHPSLQKVSLFGGSKQVSLTCFTHMCKVLKIIHVFSELTEEDGDCEDQDYKVLLQSANSQNMKIWISSETLEVVIHSCQNLDGSFKDITHKRPQSAMKYTEETVATSIM